MDIKQIVLDLCSLNDEQEWFEFKENWFQPEAYLARNLSSSLNFSFEETWIQQKRVVVLVIPAAFEIPTAFKEKRYIRIGLSKCNIKDYPKREDWENGCYRLCIRNS